MGWQGPRSLWATTECGVQGKERILCLWLVQRPQFGYEPLPSAPSDPGCAGAEDKALLLLAAAARGQFLLCCLYQITILLTTIAQSLQVQDWKALKRRQSTLPRPC